MSGVNNVHLCEERRGEHECSSGVAAQGRSAGVQSRPSCVGVRADATLVQETARPM